MGDFMYFVKAILDDVVSTLNLGQAFGIAYVTALFES